MGDNFRGFGQMLVDVLKFLAGSAVILVVLVFVGSHWIDSEFGDGTSGPYIAIALGGGFVLLVGVIFTVLANMTHRSAGDDIVALFSGMVEALGVHNRNQAQVRREELKLEQLERKDELDRNKQRRSLRNWLLKQDAKEQARRERTDEAQRKSAEADALDAEWFDVDLDDVDSVEVME